MDGRRHYVLCICMSSEKILLIEKNRPAWQAGRINFPGGSIEVGETPEEAAIRELKEETGLISDNAQIVGTIESPSALVYCVKLIPKGPWEVLNPGPQETEKVFWDEVNSSLVDSRLMPNLKVVIPMLQLSVHGWRIIHDEGIDDKFKILL